MYLMRRWSVRHAAFLHGVYRVFERLLAALHPIFSALGHDRLERPVAAVERGVKGFFFDCRMCGQCILGDTGLSCPMNCPKTLRNGPCGGVRADGHCEVRPAMPCVWVAAWEGAQRLATADVAPQVQPPLDHSREGRSSWLVAARRAAEKSR